MDKIDITALKNARNRFEDYRANLSTDIAKTASVKAFEFCYELSWKMMKRFLSLMGKEVTLPKAIFREAALANIIDNPEIWFKFQEKRNHTSHVYNEEEMNSVVSVFDEFSKELNKLIDKLDKFEV